MPHFWHGLATSRFAQTDQRCARRALVSTSAQAASSVNGRTSDRLRNAPPSGERPDNSFGQVGYPDPDEIEVKVPMAEPVNIGAKATQIAAGGYHTCALKLTAPPPPLGIAGR
jgi:hypothetical protein